VSASAGAARFDSSMITTAIASATSGARRRHTSAAQSTSAAGKLIARSPAKFASVAISTQ
jgi:hypothetical protein